ncbi:hypothetical protein N9A04_00090 [Rickettsiales bacterium]|nr:hypothetical protein [Rickettsiales bacterium]
MSCYWCYVGAEQTMSDEKLYTARHRRSLNYSKTGDKNVDGRGESESNVRREIVTTKLLNGARRTKILMGNGQSLFIEKYRDGSEVRYYVVNGVREGMAIYIDKIGNETECVYEHGMKNGIAESRYRDGSVEEFIYVNNVKSGPARFIDKEGNIYIYEYVDGKRKGNVKKINKDGSTSNSSHHGKYVFHMLLPYGMLSGGSGHNNDFVVIGGEGEGE